VSDTRWNPPFGTPPASATVPEPAPADPADVDALRARIAELEAERDASLVDDATPLEDERRDETTGRPVAVGQLVRYDNEDPPTGKALTIMGYVVAIEPATEYQGEPVPERARVAWLTGGEADGIPVDELEPIG